MPIEGDVVGGVKVSSKALVEQLQRSGRFDVILVSVSRQLRGDLGFRRWRLNSFALVHAIGRCLFNFPKADLVFANFGPGGAPAAVLIWLLSRLFGKPMVLRFFGGCFHTDFQAKNRLAQAIEKRTCLGSEMVLLQSFQQLEFFKDLDNVAWFPTTRELSPVGKRETRVPKKLLFLSQLRPEKGIAQAVAALKALPEDVTLDVYGPFKPGFDPKLLEGDTRIRYGGVVKIPDIPKLLAQYDLLLFPTYFVGEGYPGVVLEALQCGLPVIASDWQALPEILGGERGGLLIEPRSVEALVTAVLRTRNEPGLYERLAKAALARGEDFRLSRWHTELEDNLTALIERRPAQWLLTHWTTRLPRG